MYSVFRIYVCIVQSTVLAIYSMNQAGAIYLSEKYAACLGNWYVAVDLTAGAGFVESGSTLMEKEAR